MRPTRAYFRRGELVHLVGPIENPEADAIRKAARRERLILAAVALVALAMAAVVVRAVIG